MRTAIAILGWTLVLLSTAGLTASAEELYDFTLQGDSTFNKPHGGQTIQVVVIHGPTREVMGRASGVVSATADPAFSLTVPKSLRVDAIHEVRYWIDSNFGGGTPGKCDPKEIDHQWNLPATPIQKTAVVTKVKHLPSAVVDLCQSFGG